MTGKTLYYDDDPDLWVGEAIIVGVEQRLTRHLASVQIILQFANVTIELCQVLNTYLQLAPKKKMAVLVWPRFIKEQVVAIAKLAKELRENNQVKRSSKLWEKG